MAPASRLETGAKPPAQAARLSAKQPLLKSKYFQQPTRASFVGDAGSSSDSESPTLSIKSPNAGVAADDSPNNVRRSPEATPNDMGFDSTPDEPPASAISKHLSPFSQHSSRDATPRTSSESAERTQPGRRPSHKHSKSGGHIADVSLTTMPARKPLRADSLRNVSVETAPASTESAPDNERKSSEAGLLRPMTYSPQPPKASDEEGVNADGEQQGEAPRSSWLPGDDQPKLEPSAQSALSKPEQDPVMPAAPPRLPLLYFEQDSVEQMDFAYRDPRPPSQSKAGAAQHRPQLPITNKSDESDMDIIQLPPLDSPRHSPLSLDTSTPTLSKPRQIANANRPQTPPSQQSKDEAGGSFFWTSPKSSAADSAKDPTQSPEFFKTSKHQEKDVSADAEEGRKSSTPKNITSASGSEALVSASALGFGGPSDWEHFGDYSGEEVDDIDLYTSPKLRESEMQLPGMDATFDDASSTDDGMTPPEDPLHPDEMENVSPRPPFLERKILSTIEERASENFEDMFHDTMVDDGEGGTINAHALFNTHPAQPPSKRAPGIRDSDELAGPGHGNLLTRQSQASSSTETIERISFDVPPPPDSALSETSSNHSPGDRLSGGSLSNVDMPSIADLAHRKPERPPVTGPDATTPKPLPNEPTFTPSIAGRSDSTSRSIKTGHDSSVLSPTSDDGKEEIMISLDFPAQTPIAASPPRIDIEKASDHLTEPQRSPDLLRSGRKSVIPGSVPLDDPYAGLEAWAVASLNRYIKVLHDEAQTKSGEDKYKIFINFMHNEQRIRATLYDQDGESETSDHDSVPNAPPPPKTPLSQGVRVAVQQPTPPSAAPRTSKALPALPVDQSSTPNGSPAIPNYIDSALSSSKTSIKSLEGLNSNTNGSPSVAPPRADTPTKSRLEEMRAESPSLKTGKQLKEKGSGSLRGTPSLNALRKALDIVTTRKSSLTSKDTQAMANESLARASGQLTRSEFAADSKSPNSVTTPDANRDSTGKPDERTSPTNEENGHENGPNEGKPYEGDKAANRQSIYQPFSTLLRQTSIRSQPSDIGDGRASHAGRSVNGSVDESEARRNARPALQPHYRYTVLEPLLSVVPQESILRQEPEQLVHLRQGMDSIPDDFSFIHQTVLAWDSEAKKSREKYEQERHAREGQNQQRIDELFNDHEIGYSDISRLEADFKRGEAAKKTEEDREEVKTFVASVFDVVWARINFEMDQLTPLYEQCTRLVAQSSAGRGMFEEDTTVCVPIAPAMEALLILYQKLMVRHQKAFEAVLERDRRLKKVEVAPWYALGAVDKVKRIERRFEDAEKTAILEFCRQRDERANLLMDVLDQNTLRGVGANQDYMENVMKAIHAVAQGLTGGAVGEDDVVSITEVLKAKTITTALARSSEQIVQMFHVADRLLNAADYEVSVAYAKQSGADAAAFRRLRDAKAQEDQKLSLDLEHRMGLIRNDTTRTQDEISKLLLLLRDRQGSDAAAQALAESGIDADREQQLRQALEEEVNQPKAT